MELPPVLDRRFLEDLRAYHEERPMPFITTPDRVAFHKLMLEWIEDALRAKFGEEGVQLMPEIRAFEELDKLRAMMLAIATATTLAEVRRACAKAAAPEEAGGKKRKGGKRGSS
jgi:hypothetical protein